VEEWQIMIHDKLTINIIFELVADFFLYFQNYIVNLVILNLYNLFPWILKVKIWCIRITCYLDIPTDNLDTFNNISVISWQSVLLVEETGVPGKNYQFFLHNKQAISQNIYKINSIICHMSGYNYCVQTIMLISNCHFSIRAIVVMIAW
jgi:hypothetical protein